MDWSAIWWHLIVPLCGMFVGLRCLYLDFYEVPKLKRDLQDAQTPVIKRIRIGDYTRE
jgi:hypothetical protein